jgi:hypothetical protein
VGSVTAVAGAIAVLAVQTTSGGPAPSPAGTAVPAGVIAELTSLPLVAIQAAPTTGLNAPAPIDDAPLTAAGKPDLLYVGAEFCPVCAAERWPMYIALSKFGTFAPPPGQIRSAVDDGDIPTLTFYGTTYTSPYFTFTPEETTTSQVSGNHYVPLQHLTPQQRALWQRHTGGSFPWVDFAGKEELATAQYNATELEGRTFPNIASQVGDSASSIGQNIDGSAAVLVKTICSTLSHDQPAKVCKS